MKNLYLILGVLLMLAACKTTEPVKVYPIKDVGLPAAASMVYALPKTVVQITVYQTAVSSHTGPLHRYAEKYLQLHHVIKENKTEYFIDSIVVKTFPVLDTTRIYVIENITNTAAENIKLCPDGRLLGFNSQQVCPDFEADHVSFVSRFAPQAEALQYLDSIILPKTYYSLRSDDEKAKFLVEQLHIIQDDINFLRVGETPGDGFPDGRAMELMIKELKQAQENYVSLFRGRESRRQQKFVYTIAPDDANMFSTRILFRFSPERGVLEVNNMAGEPIYLDLINDNSRSYLDKYSSSYVLNKQKNEEFNGVYYRLPQHTKIVIRSEREVYEEVRELIAQFGTLLNLPDYMLLNPKNRIEFDPRYGSLRCVELKYPEKKKE